jgi:hypothetical protein
MKSILRNILLFFMITGFASCTSNADNKYLFKIFIGDNDQIGATSGYLNAKGDTIIPLGKYYYCFTDTLKTIAIVLKKNGEFIAINYKDKYLFTVFPFDNGPDPPSEGLFRILKNGKIGYANLDGKITIKPQFICAFPFNNGRAKVSFKCQSVKTGEYNRWESESWFYIDKKGKKIRNAL